MLCKIGILKSFKKHFLTRRVKLLGNPRALGRLTQLGTWAFQHLRHSGTQCTLALGHLSNRGTRNTLFSRIQIHVKIKKQKKNASLKDISRRI